MLRPGDQALLLGFAQAIAVWQELTPSKEALRSALERAGQAALPTEIPQGRPPGGTLLYDAVVMAASGKLQRIPGRKAMIVISDGEDIGSVAKMGQAVKAAQEADAVVYSIHFVADEHADTRQVGMSALLNLSEPTGGRMFRVSTRVTLTGNFRPDRRGNAQPIWAGVHSARRGEARRLSQVGSESHPERV